MKMGLKNWQIGTGTVAEGSTTDPQIKGLNPRSAEHQGPVE